MNTVHPSLPICIYIYICIHIYIYISIYILHFLLLLGKADNLTDWHLPNIEIRIQKFKKCTQVRSWCFVTGRLFAIPSPPKTLNPDFAIRNFKIIRISPKTQMTMENQPFEDVSPIKNCDFPLPRSFSAEVSMQNSNQHALKVDPVAFTLGSPIQQWSNDNPIQFSTDLRIASSHVYPIIYLCGE